jgi:hypothetical protein
MPTWNAQLQAGFVFVGLDPNPTDPSRSVDSRFAAEMASNAGFTVPLAEFQRFFDTALSNQENLYRLTPNGTPEPQLSTRRHALFGGNA